ncbi:MAG: hypothetical protein ACO1RT_14245 [Planctomycetaceae bacterium]
MSALKNRFVMLAVMLCVSWVVMTCTHELGHIIGGWSGGATLVDFEIRPWRLAYSLHNPDPNPQRTLWLGPLFGVAAPIAIAALVRRRVAWFVADFCLVANGGYLALAWLSGDRFLDTPRLLAAGTHPAWIAVYCIVTISIGYIRFRADCMSILSASATAHADAATETIAD